MKILKRVYTQIMKSYPLPPPEQGGILGIKNGIICEYYHDNSCNITDCAVYEPDVDVLNQKIEEWNNQDIQFAGLVHSHIPGQNALSSDDKSYIELLFKALPECIIELYFPIIIPEERQIIAYIVKRNNKDISIQSDKIYII